MTEFTKEEKSLCKQIAGKHKKKIEYGDWYINFDEEVRLKEFFGDGYREEDCFPLWTISDCLEFLREEGFYLSINTLGEYWTCLAYKHIFNEENKDIGPRIFFQEKTLLSVLLKIVLAVLEEGK